MSAVASLGALAAIAADVAPSPSPSQGPSALEVTPGLAGFLATFAVAVACVLLFLSLTRHLRRATRNAQEQGIEVTEPRRIGFGRHPQAQDGPTVLDPRADGEPGAPADGTPTAEPDGTQDEDRR